MRTYSIWADARWAGRHGIGRYATEVLARLGDTVRSLPFSGKPADARDAFRALGKYDDADLIYSPGYAGFISRAPQLLTLHDLIHLEVGGPQGVKYVAYYNAIIRPIIRRSKAVLTVSETSAHAIREWLGDDTVDVINAGNACSPAFKPPTETTASREHILYVGNMRAHKNPGVAMSILREDEDLRLRMVLPARERSEAILMADRMGVGSRVSVISGLEDQELAREYHSAIATVMPSSLEGFGLPALESVCSGTPVVYWQGCAAIAEAAKGAGIPINELHDPAEWAKNIRAVRDNATPARPTERPSWDDVAKRVSTTVREVASRGLRS
ncbi:glycosyltransferase [Microbacterium oleivorans]|uniref:Glycosyltransferase, group 1 family protein n=1 Tax=Microbacterium oleivorans TaxID=273677 RepID=A0A031FZG2_9MICO|nr:glycosyltransferase [Microbacterium oleivorans]EZP29040.1 Glycosyltransferase, group 1 family protein [Microbacterium oleivorans]